MRIKKASQIEKLEQAIKALNDQIERECNMASPFSIEARILWSGKMYAYQACLDMITGKSTIEIEIDGCR